MKNKSGFTLIETMMVVAITAVASTVSLFSFSDYGSTEALSKDQGRIVSVLEKARAMTLDSLNSSQYGVHFGTSTVTIFPGAAYSSSNASNIVTELNSKVIISDIKLYGDGPDVVFNRLSGETNQFGTTTISLASATSTTRSVTVYRTGLIQPN